MSYSHWRVSVALCIVFPCLNWLCSIHFENVYSSLKPMWYERRCWSWFRWTKDGSSGIAGFLSSICPHRAQANLRCCYVYYRVRIKHLNWLFHGYGAEIRGHISNGWRSVIAKFDSGESSGLVRWMHFQRTSDTFSDSPSWKEKTMVAILLLHPRLSAYLWLCRWTVI